MFLKRGKDKIIQNIERRIADFTFIPLGKSFCVMPMSACLSLSFHLLFCSLILNYEFDMFDIPTDSVVMELDGQWI